MAEEQHRNADSSETHSYKLQVMKKCLSRETVHRRINIQCLYISTFKMACVWLSLLLYSSL